ncbi:Threonyl-tRNA synthetase [Spironucleus salmonicida]|uniref:threonine--tRNA ligase n=1 Tax=Spironucleus salmonicida TaxID=348837 RepID=V6LW53_9EUKA|nr:Threonyl-tRNA synthetase [Spironucleus salmonicida]|eukprot:EST48795.1 Threonyl-tRNA synthetase [Spironucleus salmonicida]
MTFMAERIAYFEELKALYPKPQADESIKITVTLNGEKIEASKFTCVFQLLPKKHSFIACIINDVVSDLSTPLSDACNVATLTFEDPRGKEVFWHSAAHVLGYALETLYEAKLGHGPALENNFFYDAEISNHIDLETLPKIEAHIASLVKTAQKERKSRFERLEISKVEALKMFAHNKFKVELITELVKDGETCTIYKCADFVDFCRGPHVPDLSLIQAVKLLNCSAAYFKGDQARESMQRVYGVAFPSKKELEVYLDNIEEAKKRDHRNIGKEMDLFMMHKFAPGMPMLYNNGTKIYRRLEDFIRTLLHKYHYLEVLTPNFLNTEMWKISGHLEHYQQNMFLLQQNSPSDPLFGLKPMNCPGHCLMFASQHHAKTELPIRMSEFGVVHRKEASGALGGLTRVQRFEQDDAHVFCAPDQIQAEIQQIMNFLVEAYAPFELEFKFGLSLRPQDRIGEDSLWDQAENALRTVLQNSAYEFEEFPGEGAFYGPKIDVHLKDALNRFHQCGTVQLDFNLPQRFNLEFAETVDGKQQYSHPVMIHRAILGSIERFMAILIEHTAGKFPFWVSPRQILIVPVNQEFDAHCRAVCERIYQAGFDAKCDCSDEKMNKKIARGFGEKWNFVCVVGAKDIEGNGVTVQGRSLGKIQGVEGKGDKLSKFYTVEDFIALCGGLAGRRDNV